MAAKIILFWVVAFLVGFVPTFAHSAQACVKTVQEFTYPLAFVGADFVHLLNHETKKFEDALNMKLPSFVATVVIHDSPPFAVVSQFDHRGCLRGQFSLPLEPTHVAIKKALEKDAKKVP